MPHVNGGGGEDLASVDEVKVYKEEGDEGEEKATEISGHLNDVKSDLVASGEEDKSSPLHPGYVSPKNVTPLPLRSGQLSPIVGKSTVDNNTLTSHDRPLNMGYIVTSYPYAPNGTAPPIPVSMGNKMGLGSPHPGSPLSFVMYPSEPFGQPPPAHMGIPPVHIDPKTGIPRPPMYSLPTPGQYPHPIFTSEFPWHSSYPITTATGFRGPFPTSLVTSAGGLPRFPPAGLLPPHPGLPPSHSAIPHPAIVTPGPKQDVAATSLAAQERSLGYFFLPALNSANGMLYNPSYHGNHLPSTQSAPSPDLMAYQLTLDLTSLKHAQQNQDGRHSSSADPKSLSSSNSSDMKSGGDSNSHHHHGHHHHHHHNSNNGGGNANSGASSISNSSANGGGLLGVGCESSSSSSSKSKKLSHIKKPLNAFMLYMKEMRAKVVAECTLKESAAINQILGRRWHALGRDEQAKYYDMARKERQLHMQMYPGWSARDNYAQQGKKKKRKRDKSVDGEGSNPKKCRARFGLDQQGSWCKPCRRKKKCIRYQDGSDTASVDIDDNLGSVGSSGDLGTPKSLVDSDQEQHNTSSEISLSSPPAQIPMDVVMSPTTPSSDHHHHHQYHHPHPQHHQHPHQQHRPQQCNSNPHDASHPLSISSLTGKCLTPTIKREPGPSLDDSGRSSSSSGGERGAGADSVTVVPVAPAIVSVT